MENLLNWSQKCCFFGEAAWDYAKCQHQFALPLQCDTPSCRVSLAIDTKECDAAAATLRTYLHKVAVTDTTSNQHAPRTPSKAQSTPRHINKAQYAAGAQLYVLEVVLPQLPSSNACLVQCANCKST